MNVDGGSIHWNYWHLDTPGLCMASCINVFQPPLPPVFRSHNEIDSHVFIGWTDGLHASYERFEQVNNLLSADTPIRTFFDTRKSGSIKLRLWQARHSFIKKLDFSQDLPNGLEVNTTFFTYKMSSPLPPEVLASIQNGVLNKVCLPTCTPHALMLTYASRPFLNSKYFISKLFRYRKVKIALQGSFLELSSFCSGDTGPNISRIWSSTRHEYSLPKRRCTTTC